MRRARGFTLIELLVVVAIMVILATIVAVGLIPLKKKAYKEKTKALLQKIQTALDTYFNEFRDYPPDGYDNEGNWPTVKTTWPFNATQGVYLGGVNANGSLTRGHWYKGSGCLIYFLCHPINNITRLGADAGEDDSRQVRVKPVGPFLGDIPRDAFSTYQYDPTFDPAIHPLSSDFQASWASCEILDAWMRPIHYDKVKDATTYFQANRFKGSGSGEGVATHSDATYRQGIWSTLVESDEWICPAGTKNANHDTYTTTSTGNVHADPRCPANSGSEADGCLNQGGTPTARNLGSYDLWSHGPSWTNPKDAITNWGKGN